MIGLLAWAAASAAACEFAAVASGVAVASGGGAGFGAEVFSTAKMPVTGPRKTTSSDCRPGHFPGGSFEQVQAGRFGVMRNRRKARVRKARWIIMSIVHGEARGNRGELGR